MLKIIGAVLVLLACAGYTGGLLGQIRRHRDVLRSCLELTDLLAGEIRYDRVPIAEALHRICQKTDRELSFVLKTISDGLKTGDYAELEELWDRSFEDAGKRLFLTEEELGEVQDIGKNLGFLDTQAQMDHLAGCRERLKKSLEKIQRELDEKRRLYRYLSLAAGIFVILILV